MNSNNLHTSLVKDSNQDVRFRKLGKETITINYKKKIFKVTLKGLSFKEGKYHILYIPSLNLSAYGDNLKEANKMMNICLEEFGINAIAFGEDKFNDYLKDFKWKKKKSIIPIIKISDSIKLYIENIKEEIKSDQNQIIIKKEIPLMA